MPKKTTTKGNLRRSDYVRAVVTDTLPEEVPIVFSNDGFYKNLSSTCSDINAAEFIEQVLTAKESYTKPYRYNVLKDSVSVRGLSLLHPSAQRDVSRFYQKFDSLICHYCSKTENSLRSPKKVGSTFFVRGPKSESHKLKGSPVQTVNLDTTTSNPSSYFAYSHINRAHQFFNSNDYLHLEKKYSVFRLLDVSKCFSSIYTHTVYWAVDSIESAKQNGSSVGFPNEFDRLMQSMNYNETNGICIGPEISRIFAEIIFSDVDRSVINRLAELKLVQKVDYDFRRYVDDYYVFTRSKAVADQVTGVISVSLAKFKLHLNEAKMETIERPFLTEKSKLITSANEVLAVFFDKILDYNDTVSESSVVPKRIYRSDALIRDFTVRVKAFCALHSTGYDTISDYLVSALNKRIIELSESFERPLEGPHPYEDRYVSVFLILIETIFFFYTVNPTVRASLYVAQSLVHAGRMFENNFNDRVPFLCESIVRWTIDLVKSVERDKRHTHLTAVPLEILNVLLPMRELANNEYLIDELVILLCSDISQFEYFEIVSFLFIIADKRQHRSLRTALFVRAQQIVSQAQGPRVCAQSSHLVLDLLSCPFLPLDKRSGWFNRLRGICGLPKIPAAEARRAVEAIAQQCWFVRWDHVDFLALLRKKELSPTY